MSWNEYITAIEGLGTVIISVIALIRSSKAAQNARLEKQHETSETSIERLDQAFQDHLVKEVADITELKVNFVNVDAKLIRILNSLEKP